MTIPRHGYKSRIDADQPLPRDEAAESALLASVLVNPSCAANLFARFTAADFFSINNQKLFQAMFRLHRKGLDIDVTTLLGEAKAEFNSKAGSVIAELFALMPSVASYESYARVVEQKSEERRMWVIYTDMQVAINGGVAPSQAIREAVAKMPPPVAKDTLNFISTADMDRREFKYEFLIDRVLVRDQLAVIAGPKKGMKTSLLCDASISMATATPFLEYFPVDRRLRVAMCSGETGMGTLQETCRRIALHRGLRLGDVEGLFFYDRVHPLDDLRMIDAIATEIDRLAVEVLIVEPLYLMLNPDKVSNLFSVGQAIDILNRTCMERNCTLVLAHHTRKSSGGNGFPGSEYGILELQDLAFAGVQEFVRQWCLVNRRSKFAPGSGFHDLSLNVGGSAGHSGLWGIDIYEGVRTKDGPPRVWEPTVMDWDACKAADSTRRRTTGGERKVAQQEQADADAEAAVRETLRNAGRPMTQREMEACRPKGTFSHRDFRAASTRLAMAGELVLAEIKHLEGDRLVVRHGLYFPPDSGDSE